MLEVKVSSRGSGSDIDISQFVGNADGIWGECRFHVNAPVDRADVWLVVEDIDDDDRRCRVPRESIVFLSAETSWPPGFFDENLDRKRFLDQFAWIYSHLDIYRSNVTAALPFLPWMINANHGPSISQPHHRDVGYFRDLDVLDKPKNLSVICSNQTLTAQHRMRLRFVTALKEHFGDELDWYGNGINPIAEKWEGLAPYKYTIAVENHMADNVVTEKLWDPLLALTFPLYAGAPNVDEYLPRNSHAPLNVADLNGSIAVIEELLEKDPYEQMLPFLREAKDAVVGPLNVYSRMADVAHNHARRGSEEDIELTPLAPTMVAGTGEARSIVRALGEQINKVGDFLVQQSLRHKD